MPRAAQAAIADVDGIGDDVAVRIPHTSLQPATLRALIEEFITREGTDYGDTELSLERKVEIVMAQLQNKTASIVYDEDSETCSIMATRP